MTDWDGFEYTEIHDSVEDLVAALHGEPTNADLNRWGLYRAAVQRQYHTTPAQRQTTQVRATQVWVWNRNVVLTVVAGVACWLALWAALRP